MSEISVATTPTKQPSGPNASSSLALLCAQAAIDKKALHTLILNVGKLGSFTDFFVIASGTNEKQVQAAADEVVSSLIKQGRRPRMEGYAQGRWVLIDTGDVVVHIFHEEIRSFYKIEDLWLGAPRLAIPEEFYTNPTIVHSSAPH